MVFSLLKTQRKGAGVIDKIELTAKNLTSNAEVLLLLNYTEEQRISQDFSTISVLKQRRWQET